MLFPGCNTWQAAGSVSRQRLCSQLSHAQQFPAKDFSLQVAELPSRPSGCRVLRESGSVWRKFSFGQAHMFQSPCLNLAGQMFEGYRKDSSRIAPKAHNSCKPLMCGKEMCGISWHSSRWWLPFTEGCPLSAPSPEGGDGDLRPRVRVGMEPWGNCLALEGSCSSGILALVRECVTPRSFGRRAARS